MHYRSLSQVQSDLKSGKLNLPQLVEYYLSNIRKNSHLNAFLSVYGDETLIEARRIQEKFDQGKAGKLAGLVVAIKDVLCYQDHPLQCGSKILEGFQSQFNATAIQRLLDEDAIIIGRLNCDEFAMGSSNENSAFGPVRNPVDTDRVPGGSSGGSAAAVAADLCLAALGTDTGGSVRQPAAFCGVVGMKPTYSRISRYGLAAYASSFDTIGIVSHTVEDSAILLEIMAGNDTMDSTSSTEPTENYSDIEIGSEKFKVGVIGQSFQGAVDNDIRNATKEVVRLLQQEGHEVNEVDFEILDYALPTYYILTTAEASSNLSRYDGIRYGHRTSEQADLIETYTKSRSEGFGEEVKRRILLGTFVLSASYYDAYYTKAQKVRRLVRDKLTSLFKEFDFLILPTTPTTAFKIGQTSDPLEMYLADLFTVPASVAGMPAISIPVDTDSKGLPIGLQVVSDSFTEKKLLAFSQYLMNHAYNYDLNGQIR